MDTYTRGELLQYRGHLVRAFHPRRFGVVNTGKLVTVGSTYALIDYGTMLGGLFRTPIGHVTEVVL